MPSRLKRTLLRILIIILCIFALMSGLYLGYQFVLNQNERFAQLEAHYRDAKNPDSTSETNTEGDAVGADTEQREIPDQDTLVL